MNWPNWLLRALDAAPGAEVLDWRFSLSATWTARQQLLLAGCLALAVLAAFYYARRQRAGAHARWSLAALRGAALALLLAMLAEPTLSLDVRQPQRPALWLLVDTSESMAIRDRIGSARQSLADGPLQAPTDELTPPRLDQVRDALAGLPADSLAELAQAYDLQWFSLAGSEGVSLEAAESAEPAALQKLEALQRVTAIGAALADLAARPGADKLAGLFVFSDFDQNAGPPAVEAAQRLGAPIYAIGVGPARTTDVQVSLQVRSLLKKAELETPLVVLNQQGLDGQSVAVKLLGQPLEGPTREPVVLGEKLVRLQGPVTLADFQFVPEIAGRWLLSAEATPLPDEALTQNNAVQREVSVRDDFLRLQYVEYEPTWEWRFIKEVFHRDPLVGQAGFRTFLRSADPRVRQTNELFLPALAQARNTFFTTDAIFLGDMPGAALSSRFCDWTREFVDKFGGGLVVIGGPRFGPGELYGTALADMLPVVLDPQSQRREGVFTLQLTAEGLTTDFMRLGADAAENERAWENLGPLPWYRPSVRLHPLATPLAVHPRDTCADGVTPQPLVAIRRFGRGEVVYLAFNETWRLRRRFGERYYRQFWGQMIHRLGLSHAVGAQKRFVARMDRDRYQVDEEAVVTVEVYDENFEPLASGAVPGAGIRAELRVLGETPAAATGKLLVLSEARPGAYEARIPLASGGEHRLRIDDPVTGDTTELSFPVASLSIERRSSVRDVDLQNQIAQASGGRALELADLPKSFKELPSPTAWESRNVVVPLWNTWPAFLLIVGLLKGEWILRKRQFLA